MLQEIHMSTGIFLKLMTEAKSKGTGTKGNSKLLIKLLELFTDRKYSGMERTWRTIQKLSNNIALPDGFHKQEFHADTIDEKRYRNEEILEAYTMLRNFVTKFLKSGRKYPYDAISLDDFEKNLSLSGRRPFWDNYKYYLAEMGNLCDEFLDDSKKETLIYTLLEIIRQDEQIDFLFYGNRFIQKSELYGTNFHQKHICAEALLLGVLYHVHKQPCEANTENCHLLHMPERLPFQIKFLGNQDSSIFWLNPDEFQKIFCQMFETEHEPHPEKNIAENSSLVTHKFQKLKELYPLELRTETGEILETPLKITDNNIFLYGSGAAGKSTILQQLQNENRFILPLNQYRQEFHEEILPDIPCWILVQILLKYHYQYKYYAFEICAAQEGKETVLRQVAELLELFRNTPENHTLKYMFLLDGFNETLPELQECLAEELNWICENLKNVRIIITGRMIPQYEIFEDFSHVKVYGVPNETRNQLLSKLPNYPDLLRNEQLLEILRLPLFLNMYLENHDKSLCTRGEILDNYTLHLKPKMKKHVKALQFVIRYALPFAARKMLRNYDYTLTKADLSEAVEKAYAVYLKHERIYQNYTSIQKFRKGTLLEEKESLDFVEMLIENSCFMAISEGNQLSFTHQYFRDYFGAKYVLNLLECLETAFSYEFLPEKEKLFRQYELDSIWYVGTEENEIYQLIGEISGDYRNIPNSTEAFEYHYTILDDTLNMCRIFQTPATVENIIKCMSIVRNGTICGTNFTSLILPLYLPINIKFSLNGKYPSTFRNCRVQYIPEVQISCTSLTPDKNILLLGMSNGDVFFWDIKQKTRLKDYSLYPYISDSSYFQQVLCSPDGKYIACLLSDRLLLLDAQTETILFRHVIKKPHYENMLLFSENSEYLFMQFDSNYMLLNLKTYRSIEIKDADNSGDSFVTAVFSHDNQKILILDSHLIILWTLNGSLIQKHHSGDMLLDAAFLPDDSACLFCTENYISKWNLKSNIIEQLYVPDTPFIEYAAISPDGEYCVMQYQNHVHLIHISTQTDTELPENQIQKVLFSDNGFLLHILKENNQIELIQYAFSGEKTVLSIETYPQSFKKCNFQDASYDIPENKEILRRLGAIIE